MGDGCKGEALHILVSCFLVHTSRYKQYGRRCLQAASDQSILLRERELLSLSLCKFIPCAFSYSFQHNLFHCHTLLSFIACLLLTFYMISSLFISQSSVGREPESCLQCSFTSLLSCQLSHLSLSCYPSAAGVLYNPTDL